MRRIMAEISETAERIREKAHDLFMQYGLRSVSMDDIAGALGMSKKTIYQFYEDKDGLVQDVIVNLLNQNECCCEKDRDESENAIHEIFLAMDFMMEMFRSMNPSLVFDMQKYYPAAFKRFLQHKNDYLFGVIKTNIQRGIREGLYREEINVDIIARFRVESIMLPFDPSFYTKVKQDLASIEEELMLYFLFGMASQKGYKLAVKYREERNKKTKKEDE